MGNAVLRNAVGAQRAYDGRKNVALYDRSVPLQRTGRRVIGGKIASNISDFAQSEWTFATVNEAHDGRDQVHEGANLCRPKHKILLHCK